MSRLRLVLWVVPLLFSPLSLEAGNTDPAANNPEAAPPPEEGTVVIKDVQLKAQIVGRPGRMAKLRLSAYNPGQQEVSMSVRVMLMEVAQGSGESRMEPEDIAHGSQVVEVVLGPKTDQGYEVTLTGLRLSPKRAARLMAKGRLYVDILEAETEQQGG